MPPRAPGGRRRCRSCRSSTPTSPSGSAAGSPARRSTRQLGYWRQRLRGAAGRARASRRPAPARRAASHRGAAAPLRARRPARPRPLAALARREGATPFMVLLAASMLALLSRYSGQRRPRHRHADRQPQPRGDRGADRLLRQHPGAARGPGRGARLPRPAAPGARDHPRGLRPPGPAVREAGRRAAAGARPGRTPFFQVMFALQNTPLPAARPAAASPSPPRSRRAATPSSTSRLALVQSAARRPAGGDRVRHRPLRSGDRSSASPGICASCSPPPSRAPSAALATLPLLDAGQRAPVLQEWNDTAPRLGRRPLPSTSSSRRRPTSGPRRRRRSAAGRRLTYGELEARANRLAAPPAGLGSAAASRSGSGWSARSTSSSPCSAS